MIDSKILGGAFLIAGMTIGVSMLPLPLLTGVFGFVPSMLVFIFCWIMMLWVAFLFLELVSSFDKKVNLITMARKTLGLKGQIFTWSIYLVLFYTLLMAYLVVSRPLFTEFFALYFGVNGDNWLMLLPFVVVGVPLVYRGVEAVDYFNRFLVVGLVTGFILLIFFFLPHFDAKKLTHYDLEYSFISLSILITAFGYHIIIPNLYDYFDKDIKKIKTTIILGSLIPLAVYLVWEILLLGSIPLLGQFGLAHAYKEELTLPSILDSIIAKNGLTLTMHLFSFFAVATSFFSVALSVKEFVSDGLKLASGRRGKIIAIILAFCPPYIMALSFGKKFIPVLDYAGVFVCLLFGLLPITMIWQNRYKKQAKSVTKAFGGKFSLSLLYLFFVFIIAIVILREAGLYQIDVHKYFNS